MTNRKLDKSNRRAARKMRSRLNSAGLLVFEAIQVNDDIVKDKQFAKLILAASKALDKAHDRADKLARQ